MSDPVIITGIIGATTVVVIWSFIVADWINLQRKDD